jgi:hypothetical protein
LKQRVSAGPQKLQNLTDKDEGMFFLLLLKGIDLNWSEQTACFTT